EPAPPIEVFPRAPIWIALSVIGPVLTRLRTVSPTSVAVPPPLGKSGLLLQLVGCCHVPAGPPTQLPLTCPRAAADEASNAAEVAPIKMQERGRCKRIPDM